jgi:hypothetical protein
VSGVALGDDATPGGQSGNGISASHGKCQGEITGTENGHRSKRDLPGPEIRPGDRLPIGESVIDPGIGPAAFDNQPGKHPDLTDCSRKLAFQSAERQGRFKMSPFDQGGSEGQELVSNCFQEEAPLPIILHPVNIKVLLGQPEGTLYLFRTAFMKNRRESFPGRRVAGPERVRTQGDEFRTDELPTSQLHV